MLARFQMTDCIPAKVPLDPSLPLLYATDKDKRTDQQEYQELTGSLNHLAVFSRPDISFAVSTLAQFNSDPTQTHMNAGCHVLRYLQHTKHYSITYGFAENLNIRIYADADWGSDRNTRRSTTGYVAMFNNGPVSWSSHKQTSIALSIMEAEFMALSDASREAIARIQFFDELGINVSPPLLLSDNQQALSMVENPVQHQRTKHIDIQYRFIRQIFHSGKITIDYVPSIQQVADVLTKSLGPLPHQRCVSAMNIC